jgi:hypothetical protein
MAANTKNAAGRMERTRKRIAKAPQGVFDFPYGLDGITGFDMLAL